MKLNIDRPVIKETTLDELSTRAPGLSSGPGAIMFEPGPNPRIRRAPVRAIGTMTWDGGPREVFAQVLNISPGGCLLKTESTIEPGTILDMSIMLIGNGERITASVRGKVCHETREDGRRAYGVEFLRQTAQDKENTQWLYGQAMNQR